MIITLALSPSLDVTYEVDELRRGDISRPTRVTHVAGGKALNVARVATALGADALAVAALGGRSGAWVADLLASDGVAATVVPIRRNTRTCLAIVEHRGASSSTDVYEPATALDAEEWVAFGDAALGASSASGPSTRLVLSGSLPPGAPAEEVADLLDGCRRAGAWVALDGSGEGLRITARSADLLKVNRSEAAELLAEDASAKRAAYEIFARFGVDVIVTDGVRGGSAIVGGEPIALSPPATPGRFSAGSGDAFLGGLLAALERGADGPTALEAARDAAERNALCPGQGVLAPSRA